MKRGRRKKLRFTKRFPFITFSGPHGGNNSCRAKLKRVEHHLERAINSCDARGYTAMTKSRGCAFDDPRVKALMRKRDALLNSKACRY